MLLLVFACDPGSKIVAVDDFLEEEVAFLTTTVMDKPLIRKELERIVTTMMP